MNNKRNLNLGRQALFLILILFCWSIIILLSGENPFSVFYYLVKGSVTDTGAFLATANKMFVIVLTALAVSIPAWTGMWNIGGEGQLLLGALTAAWMGISFHTHPAPLNITIALFGAAAAGALWAWWPALLKVHLQVDEVVTTLLSNYIVTFFTAYMVNFPLRAPGSTLPRTRYISEDFVIPSIKATGLSYLFVIALIILLATEIIRRKTIGGYEYRMVGKNEQFARQGGIDINKKRINAMLTGGALSGLAGGLLALGVAYCFIDGISPGYGFTGLLAALIANYLPLPILGIGFVFSALQAGSINVQLFTNIPAEITGVLQSVLVFFVAARKTLHEKIKKIMTAAPGRARG